MDLMGAFNRNSIFITSPDYPLQVEEAPNAPKVNGGVCLVVGTHPNWANEVIEALCNYPDASLCAVNEAVRLIKPQHFVTCHREKLDKFMDLYRQYHGKVLPDIHMMANAFDKKPINYPCTEWPLRLLSGSATFAAGAMVMLGYDKVILCGCPMNGNDGYAMKDTHKSTRDDPRIGEIKSDHPLIKTWHKHMSMFKEEYPDMAAKIASISGKTKEVFGGIEKWHQVI